MAVFYHIEVCLPTLCISEVMENRNKAAIIFVLRSITMFSTREDIQYPCGRSSVFVRKTIRNHENMQYP